MPEEFEDQAEASILRQELGSLITDLRTTLFNASKDTDLSKEDLIEMIRDVIDG